MPAAAAMAAAVAAGSAAAAVARAVKMTVRRVGSEDDDIAVSRSALMLAVNAAVRDRIWR